MFVFDCYSHFIQSIYYSILYKLNMKKTSKTQNSQELMENLIVNSSLEDWNYKNPISNKKQGSHSLSQCLSCGSQTKKSKKQVCETASNQHTKQSFYKAPLTPSYKHAIVIPDVSKSLSQHRDGSKLSLQLNQISVGFNKQNIRIQQALFQIRQSTVKKEKQRYLKSMSQSKKSETSKKSRIWKIDKKVVRILDFQNGQKDQLRNQNVFFKKIQNKCPLNKLKKRNLNELMMEQRDMIRNFKSRIG